MPIKNPPCLGGFCNYPCKTGNIIVPHFRFAGYRDSANPFKPLSLRRGTFMCRGGTRTFQLEPPLTLKIVLFYFTLHGGVGHSQCFRRPAGAAVFGKRLENQVLFHYFQGLPQGQTALVPAGHLLATPPVSIRNNFGWEVAAGD